MNNILCAIIFFAFMLGNAGKSLASEVISFTERDSGKTVGINVADELEIVLPANPTTGYIWETDSPGCNFLSHSKVDFLPGDKTIGSGGFEINRFKANAEGTCQLKFIFHRPFEHNVLPIKTFTLTIIIKTK
ncbi:MAG: protease inhibitor I42 family protein [Methylobacter sp.]